MSRARRPVRSALLALGLAACSHSEPPSFTRRGDATPFELATPIRLTYSVLGDHQPGFSADGKQLTYVYERPGADHDRCIGVMPAGGGTRQHDLCAWQLGEATRSDGLESPALRDDGAIAFTLHSGVIGNLTSDSMGLYVGQVDSIAGARLVLKLGTQPAGASRSWSELVDPVWLDDDELLVLAAYRHLVNASKCGHPLDRIARDCDRTPLHDTLGIGIEFARLRLDATGATVVQTMPATDVIAWSLDRQAGLIHYLVQRPRPDLAEVFHESLADSVFAVQPTGGVPVLRYGTAGGDDAPLERLHGVASGHGRLFISRSWRGADVGMVIGPGTRLFSDISEVLPDGSLRLIATQLGWYWGRLRLSADGRFLVAEAVERTTSDLYLLELDP